MSEHEDHLQHLRRELGALRSDVAFREAGLGGEEGRRLREQVQRVEAELAVLVPQCEALEASLFASELKKAEPSSPASRGGSWGWTLFISAWLLGSLAGLGYGCSALFRSF